MTEQEVEVGREVGAQLEWEDEIVGGTKFGEEVEVGGEVGAQLEWEDEIVGGTKFGEEVES